ncbi:MAG: hypothetical protein LBI03_01495 [Clostridiales bacterium]|jgi:hypothetical protein|nr:hypothetical protein [Clostridiales bacterium]
MGTKNNMKNTLPKMSTLPKWETTRNYKGYILIAIFILITVSTIAVVKAKSNPNLLRNKSEVDIRNEMLELTPIGTNKKDVVEIIENHGEWYLPVRTIEEVLSVRIGEYGIIFKTTVVVVWYFDDELKVWDITVNISTDTL